MTRVRPAADLSALEARIGYAFSQKALVELAFTHVSAAVERGSRVKSNQRLEFLGDKVLGLVIADMLYTHFSEADEGEFSRRLAELVRKESCADVAADLSLGDHLRLDRGEALSGGRSKPANLADACEALIGAIFLDGGFAAAAAVVSRLWTPRMLAPRRALRDFKSMLQEWAHRKGELEPAYEEVDRSGPAHAPRFVVAVTLAGHAPAEGVGSSKRVAEQAAAEAFMAREGVTAATGRVDR